MHGGGTMEKYSEVFVAFDVAKKKHAVAIAEGGRSGEVRFLGEVENNPLPIERTIKRWPTDMTGCMSALRPGRRDTGFIARSRRLVTTAWWSPQLWFRNGRASGSRRTGGMGSRWRGWIAAVN